MSCSCYVWYIGLAVLLRYGLALLQGLYNHFLRPAMDLKKLGSWAIVTGATDGIGLAYARELANKGLNIVLLSRSEEKLKQVAEELSTQKRKVEVKYLAVNFADFRGPIVDKVKALVADLDIAVLVNNVGMSYPFPQFFTEISDKTVTDIVDINSTSLATMTHIVLPLFEKKKKGAILNIGSGSNNIREPLLSLYVGTKGFVESFSMALASEVAAKNIHVSCHVPCLVATKMSKIRNASFFVSTPAQYAAASVRAIGNGEAVYTPYWSHALQVAVADLLPLSLLQQFRLSGNLGIRKRGMSKLAEKQQ